MADRIRVRARFDSWESLEHALKHLKEKGIQRYEAFSPVNLKSLEDYMPKQGSTVRIWSTTGAAIGMLGFWFMCVASALIYKLVVGGKPPWSNVPYVVVMYEGTILLGALFAFFSGLVLIKFWLFKPPALHHPSFSSDSFGLEIECEMEERGQMIQMLNECGVAEIYEH